MHALACRVVDATGPMVRVSDSPAAAGPGARRVTPAAKVEVEEIDDLTSELAAASMGAGAQ